MDSDNDLFLRQYIAHLNDNLEKFAQHANEKLTNIAHELNRCQANLIILEKKVYSSLED